MVSDNGTELPGVTVLLWSSPPDWRPARRGPLGGTERQSRRRGAPAVPAHPGHQFCSFLLAPPCKSPVRRGERNVCLIIPPVGRSDSAPATGLSEAVPPPPVVLIGLAPHINVRQPGARIKTALLEAWTSYARRRGFDAAVARPEYHTIPVRTVSKRCNPLLISNPVPSSVCIGRRGRCRDYIGVGSRCGLWYRDGCPRLRNGLQRLLVAEQHRAVFRDDETRRSNPNHEIRRTNRMLITFNTVGVPFYHTGYRACGRTLCK